MRRPLVARSRGLEELIFSASHSLKAGLLRLKRCLVEVFVQKGVIDMRPGIWPFLFTLAIASAISAQTSTNQKITVPAFFGFSTSQNQTDWSNIQNAGNAVQIVVADFNVLSGYRSTAQSQFAALRQR